MWDQGSGAVAEGECDKKIEEGKEDELTSTGTSFDVSRDAIGRRTWSSSQ